MNNRTTYEQKKELFDKGLSYTEIAQELGVTRQAVAQALSGSSRKYFRFVSEKTCIYPGLRAWMNENKVSVAELVRRVGLQSVGTTQQRYRSYLSGQCDMSMSTINKILNTTGLTYEAAFAR